MGRVLRLFVGAFPPRSAVLDLHRAVSAVLEGAAVRLVPPEEIHLTLRFLGGTDEARVGDICRELEAAIPKLPPVRARISGTGSFPASGRARVLWLGLTGDLQALAAAAGNADLITPHLTVARPARGDRVEVPSRFRDLAVDLPWTLDQVRLVESRPGEKAPLRFLPLAVLRLSPDRV